MTVEVATQEERQEWVNRSSSSVCDQYLDNIVVRIQAEILKLKNAVLGLSCPGTRKK